MGISLGYYLNDRLKFSTLFGSGDYAFRSNPVNRQTDYQFKTEVGLGVIDYDNELLGYFQSIFLIQKFNLFSCGLNTKIINHELVNILKKNNIFITAYSQKNIKYKEAFDLWNLGIDSIFSDDPRDLKF